MIRTTVKGSATVAALLLAAQAGAQDNWSYTGANGPGSWASNAPACGGALQSPIVIEGTEPVVMHRLETNYNVTPVMMHNDRHTVRLTYEDGSLLTVGGKVFQLKDVSFHTPAEHRVMDRSFPMSIQFRHEALTGEIAMVAVLVSEGKANVAAEELLPHLPLEPDQNMHRADVKVNARDLMPHNKDYYRYMGSLTTPPCTEGVNWYVLKTPVEFSAQQIATVKGIVGENVRPVQPRNNRIILDAQPQ
jgi:carbonic anhydrase